MMKKKENVSQENNDFNTMQNLFSTMNVQFQEPTVYKQQQPSSLDFFNEQPTYNNPQI